MSTREQFEAWAASTPMEWNVSRYPDSDTSLWRGAYRDYTVHAAWDAWQAATAVQAAELEALRAERDELRTRLEAAERDAARYRWLRHGDNDAEVLVIHPSAGPVDPGLVWLPRRKELDDAIDSAMRAHKDDAHGERPDDPFVGHSVERGGWCVFVQDRPGEYDVLHGPFPSREEADAAMQPKEQQP